MAAHRSFIEYVKKKFDNNFWALPKAAWRPISIPLGLNSNGSAVPEKRKYQM